VWSACDMIIIATAHLEIYHSNVVVPVNVIKVLIPFGGKMLSIKSY